MLFLVDLRHLAQGLTRMQKTLKELGAEVSDVDDEDEEEGVEGEREEADAADVGGID